MTHKQYSKIVRDTAKACFEQGWTVDINEYLPTVAIDNEELGEGWFFQGEEAEELLKDIPDWLDATEEEYLVYIAQNW